MPRAEAPFPTFVIFVVKIHPPLAVRKHLL
ncbi:MAG: hypothetical protein JWR19_2972 [Pedosphaera sp.]|nr:hypothetical protein [Pedosphaera sp.]